MSQTETTYSIRAVQRVCDILDLLQRNPDGVSLMEIAEATSVPKSSAFRYLSTLESRRYIERSHDSETYKVGMAFLPLRSMQLGQLAERARPYLDALCMEFGETINLGLLDMNHITYIEIVESPKAVRLAAKPGDRGPIHATALGKAIAAHLPEDQVRAILKAEGMPSVTPSTITKLSAYLTELEGVRANGYALDNGEEDPDGRCVAVPILGSRLPAALSLSSPASRFPLDQVADVAKALADSAAKLADEVA